MFKNFDRFFEKIWANNFYNYTIILVFLFDKNASDLHFAKIQFDNNVYKLFTIFKSWKIVLSMVIRIHTFIVAHQFTNLEKSVILKQFHARVCIIRIMIKMSSIIETWVKRRRLKFFISIHYNKLSKLKYLLISCQLFNKGGNNCLLNNRINKYEKCEWKNHK